MFNVFDIKIRCSFAALELEVLRDLEDYSKDNNNSKTIS